MKAQPTVRRPGTDQSTNNHPSTPQTGAGTRLTEPIPPLRLLRFPIVRERTGLSRSTIWRLERSGAFPKHRRISANAVAWIEEEVNRWIQARVAE